MTTAFIPSPIESPAVGRETGGRRSVACRAVVTGGPADRYRRVHPAAGCDRASSAPNYAVRRLVAATAAIVVLFAAVSLLGSLVTSFGGTTVSAAEALPAASAADSSAPTRHVAAPGDTLWSIASTYRGSVDHGRYLDALIRLNGGVSIEAGQAVRLP